MSEPVITEISIYPIKPTPKGLIGFAGFLFDSKLALSSIAVYTKPNGEIRLLFPKQILPNGKEINVFYPIDRETYEVMRFAVVQKIEELTEKVKGHYSNATNTSKLS